ncbi:hypothetical protein Ancab_009170 [Ancistrocladus abbreviatus]
MFTAKRQLPYTLSTQLSSHPTPSPLSLQMMSDTIVMYPSMGISHITPMVELAKFIQFRHPSFSIIILVTPQPYNGNTPSVASATTNAALSKISTTTPSITFHHMINSTQTLPSPPPSTPSPSFLFDLASHNTSLLYHALQTIVNTSPSGTIKALVIDFFNMASLEVSSAFDIPTYIYFTSSAYALASILYLPTLHVTFSKSFKEFEEDFHVQIPGLPPLGVSDMPNSFLDRTSELYDHFLQLGRQMPRSKGFVLNTFGMLQENTLKALSDGACMPGGPAPTIFTVGPLIGGKGDSSGKNCDGNNGGGGKHDCLSWLDSQPSRSVVFLSFGSMGSFGAEQLKEIANGLEKSGHRFLWVVRAPPEGEQQNGHMSPIGSIWDEERNSLESILPEGFLDRVKDQGLVVRSWAPQFEALSHDSVGGFVTHCGWNSVLEAVWCGVPMLAWPLYAEQKLNKLFLVEEVKLALPLKRSENGLVSETELEERVRELMDSESGKAVRERVGVMKEGARAAVSEGGPSCLELDKLTALWKSGE